MTAACTVAEDFIGRRVDVVVDRPLGTRHPVHHDMVYAVNYGYIPDTLSPDGEELDAYILGIAHPVARFSGRCIGLIRRLDDDDDKLVVVPEGMTFSEEDIRRSVAFQEKFFRSVIVL